MGRRTPEQQRRGSARRRGRRREAAARPRFATQGSEIRAFLAQGWDVIEPNYRGSFGAGEAFVVEADESDGSFRQYPAEVVVITNIEADHLDNWGTAERYASGFAELVSADHVRVVVTSADDPGTRDLIPLARAAGKQVITFGEAADADVRLSDVPGADRPLWRLRVGAADAASAEALAGRIASLGFGRPQIVRE